MTHRNWRAQRLLRDLDQIEEAVKRLRPSVAEMVRRSKERAEVDGRKGNDPSNVGGGGGPSDPTLATVLARLCPKCEGAGRPILGRDADAEPVYDLEHACRDCGGSGVRHVVDPQGTAIDDCFTIVEGGAKLFQFAERMHQYVIHAGEAERGRQSKLSQCTIEACSAMVTGVGNDILRRKWCHACYFQWTVFKELEGATSDDPGADRILFERARTLQLPVVKAGGELPMHNALILARSQAPVEFDEAALEWRISEIDKLRDRGELPQQGRKG